jgi:hypothetical protein
MLALQRDLEAALVLWPKPSGTTPKEDAGQERKIEPKFNFWRRSVTRIKFL